MSICDFRTAKDIGIDRPEKNEFLHNIPPTPEQEVFIGKVIAITENRNQDVKETVSNMRSNRLEEACAKADASAVPTGENEIMTEVQVIFSLE